MMVKEIEKTGIPVVHVVNMVPVAKSIGSNRILKAYSIPAPMCDPNLPAKDQAQQRYHLMEKALEVLATDIKTQTVFSV